MTDPCWKGYKQLGLKNKKGKQVPNCVPIKEEADIHSSHKALHNTLTSSGYKLSKEHPDHYEYKSTRSVASSPEGVTSGVHTLTRHGFKSDGTDSRAGKKYVHKYKHSDGRSAVAITKTNGDSSYETKIKVSKHPSSMKEGVVFEGFDLSEESKTWRVVGDHGPQAGDNIEKHIVAKTKEAATASFAKHVEKHYPLQWKRMGHHNIQAHEIKEESKAHEKAEMKILNNLEKKTDKLIKKDAAVHKKLGESQEEYSNRLWEYFYSNIKKK